MEDDEEPGWAAGVTACMITAPMDSTARVSSRGVCASQRFQVRFRSVRRTFHAASALRFMKS